MIAPVVGRSALGVTASLTIAMASVTVLPSSLGVLAPLIRDDLHLSTLGLGMLTSCVFVVGALLSVPAGRMVDRLGGPVLLRILFAAMIAALVAGASSRGYAWLLPSMIIGGCALAISNPATNELVAERISPSAQGIAIGIKQSGVQLAPLLAGTALLWVSIRWGWRGAMAAGALCPLIGALLTLLFVPVLAQKEFHARTRQSLPWRNVGWLTVYAFLMGSAMANIGAYLPLFAHDHVGLTLSAAGLATAIVGAAGFVMRIAWGHLGNHVGRLPLLLAIVAGLALTSLIAIWLAASLWSGLLWLGAVGTGATAGAWNALGMLAIIRQGSLGSMGAASGLVLLGFYAGFVVAPLVFGLTVDATGSFDLGWGVVASCYAAATLISLSRVLRHA